MKKVFTTLAAVALTANLTFAANVSTKGNHHVLGNLETAYEFMANADDATHLKYSSSTNHDHHLFEYLEVAYDLMADTTESGSATVYVSDNNSIRHMFDCLESVFDLMVG